MTGKTMSFSIPDEDIMRYLESMKSGRSAWICEAIRERLSKGVDNKEAALVSYQQKLSTARSSTAEAEAERQAFKENYGIDIEEYSKAKVNEQVQREAEYGDVIKRAWDKFDAACASSGALTDTDVRAEVGDEIAELRRLGQSQKEISKRILTYVEKAKVRVATEKEDLRKTEVEQKRTRTEEIRVDREITQRANEIMKPWDAEHPKPAEDTASHKIWRENRAKAAREAKKNAREQLGLGPDAKGARHE